MTDASDTRSDAAGAQAPTLLDAIQAANAQPLWDRYRQLNTFEPQFLEPMLWPWSTMAGLVERAAKEVSMAQAERRVLLLTHPALPETVFTTPTLSGGLQILEPGEWAPPHRHTLAALRLVMMGQGAETITDGKVCPMEPGDLILTPAWTWHEHRHNGTARMVWFDGLDYPLARVLGTVFLEFGPGAIPPHGLASSSDDALREGGLMPDDRESDTLYSPLFRYSWSRVRSVLDAMPPAEDGSKRVRYTNPADGGPVMPTIDCFAHRIAIDAPTRPIRTTATAIAVVIEGEGESVVGDTVLRWKQHDVFTLPRWQKIQHVAHRGPATLFLMTDRALLQRIGHLREEIIDAA